MRTPTRIKSSAVAALASVAALAAFSAPAQARTCPPGNNVPRYCQTVQQQTTQIYFSTKKILAQEAKFAKEARALEAKIKSQVAIKGINALLRNAQKEVAAANRLIGEALVAAKHHPYRARRLMARARVKASVARRLAADARGLALDAVRHHK